MLVAPAFSDEGRATAASPLGIAGTTIVLHDDSADHSSGTLSSTTGGTVSLSGLSNGTLSLTGTDAMTGQQLYATNEQVASINQAPQNINIAGTTATSVNSTSGVAAASGTQSLAVGGGVSVTSTGNTAARAQGGYEF